VFEHCSVRKSGRLFHHRAARFIATSANGYALGMDRAAALRFHASGARTIGVSVRAK
jgi:hypothetical protein